MTPHELVAPLESVLGSDTFPSDTVRNLGVVFDTDCNFGQHISQVCKSCFYHIRDLRQIRRHISIAKTISTALISSRLDYCNSLLNNIAKRGPGPGPQTRI